MKIVFMERDSLGSDVDLSYFSQIGDVTFYGQTGGAENPERIKDADIIVANKIQMNEELLKDAKKLKMICLTATGTNNVDFSYTNKRGITVANVKSYSTASVVQHTFAMMFYLLEKLPYYDKFVKNGDYIRSDIFSHFEAKFHELAGMTWGIIGLGEIGRGVAEIAKLFGCRVIYYSTSGKNANPAYEQVGLNTLLEESDIVSIHAPLNSDTQNLIGEAELQKMKKTAILLNLGRGPIVDQVALTKALKEGWIEAAGLDVLTEEPMEADNPLIEIQDSTKLLITPHIAWATVEARSRCAREVFENMKSFLRGEERNIVTG